MDKLKLRVIFLGGKQAGVVSLLAVISTGCEVKAVVTVSDIVKEVADKFGIPVYHSVKQDEIQGLLPEVDLMISVHSREIIPMVILNKVWLGGINVHPCLSKYKGANPIQRFLSNGISQASVGVHRMTDKVDYGEVLMERFIEIDRVKIDTVEKVYNTLYPLYGLVLIDALRMLAEKDTMGAK